MAEDVAVKFSADISNLQSGLQQASTSVETTTRLLSNGAAQFGSSFASIGQAVSNGLANQVTDTRASADEMLQIVRINAREQFDIANNGFKLQSSSVRESAQLFQISHEEELTRLLALEQARESTEEAYLRSVRDTYAQGSAAFADYQRRIEELSSQNALRRQEIERSVNREILTDFRRSFDQIAASLSSAIMQMIRGQQTFGQAARSVALSIVQSFIQARIRSVADWAAGQLTQVAATNAAEAAKTAAVMAGETVRTGAVSAGAAASSSITFGAMISQILASAKETFAGIFGFLSPLMGPAAIGPAAAGEAVVASMASFAVGSWALPSDMIAQVHAGEMIVPAAATPWAQSLMANAASSGTGRVTVNHATHFNITALDSKDVSRWIKGNGKTIMRTVNEGVRLGTHLGFKRLQG